MSLSNNVGNAGILGAGVMGTGTTAGTLADLITQNATLIGLSLTAFSIIVGLIFKGIAAWQDAKHKRIIQEQDMEYKRWLMSRDTKD